MNGPATPPRRHRAATSIFVVAHVGVVVLLYGVALIAGGGFATLAFPPDAPAAADAHQGPLVEDQPVEQWPMAGASTGGLPTERIEVSPPWTSDADGRIHLEQP